MLGWRQSDLAQAAGLHPKAVAYWEAKIAIDYRREKIGVGRIREAFEANRRASVPSSSAPMRRL